MSGGSSRRRRIGLYGGSFDPVHLTHLALARTALDHLALDELRWVPVGEAWQKTRRLSAPAHRAAMVAAAIADEPRFVLERSELDRAGPSYTIDTLDRMRAQQPDAEWVLVIGEDQYLNLPTWRDWQRLVDGVTLAVAPRPGPDADPATDRDAAADTSPRPLQAPPALAAHPHRVVRLPTVPATTSSTSIRKAVASGDVRGYAGLVPAAVASYIAQHHLYLPEAR